MIEFILFIKVILILDNDSVIDDIFLSKPAAPLLCMRNSAGFFINRGN